MTRLSLPILRIRATTLAAMALAAALLSSDGVAAEAAPWADESQPVCADTADPWAWVGMSVVDIPMGEAEDCDVYRETVLEVAPDDESICIDAQATYSLLPNGIQAVVPQECSPTVSVFVEGVPVDYALVGVRLVMPSEHTLGGTQYAAEVQFVHEPANATLPSMVAAVWIDTNATSEADDVAGKEFLGGLVDAVEGLQASCNDTEVVSEQPEDDAPLDLVGVSVVEEANPVEKKELPKIVPGPPGDKNKDDEGPKIVPPPPPTGPAVVGRGNEQEFANDPIRRRLSTDNMAGWYDLWWLSVSSSSSWYTYETQACNRTVQWNLQASPLKVSLDFKALQTALEGTTCRPQPMSGNATAANATEPVLQASRSAPMISKVCPLATAAKEASAGTAWTPLLGLFGMIGLGLLLSLG